MKRIYLIRHAQSEFNEKGIFQGKLDSDLTPLGFVQARLVAGFLKKEGISLLISSPQKRAYKTALIIADVLDIELLLDERLREMSFGTLEGKNFWELMRTEGKVMKKWLKDPFQYPLPGQESYEVFEKRILSFLEDLLKQSQERIAVVGHGGTLHSLICTALGLKLNSLWWFHMDNTGISLLEYDGNFKLVYLNRLCHLKY